MEYLEARSLAYDTMASFIVPYFIYEYSLEVEYLWVDLDATGVNLFKQWYKIYLQQEIPFQRDSYDNFFNDEDIVGCEWTLELFVNYCDGALIKSIEESYDNLDEPEQGGITYP